MCGDGGFRRRATLMRFLLPFTVAAAFVLLPATGSLRAADPPWTLERAIERATGDSPDARIARQRLAAAQAALRQAQSTWWPRLQLQSGYVYTDNPVSVFGSVLNQQSYSPALDFNNVPDTDNLNLRGTVTLPLYAGGALEARRAAAQARAGASEWDQSTVRQELSFAVVQAWFGVRKAAAFLDTAQAAVHSYETNLAIAQTRYTEGTLLKPEVLDLRVRLAQAQEDLLRARNGQELARRALGNLLGLENTAAEAANETATLVTPAAEQDFAARPELEADELRARAARAEVKQARSGYLPSLNAFAAADYDYGWQNHNGAASYTAGLMLKWNLWDGRETSGRVAEAGANLEIAEERRRQTRLDIDLQVHQARLALTEASGRLEVTDKSIALAEESVALTRARFEEGRALATQLIDAETALTGARVRRISAENDRQIAIAALRRALGLPMVETPRPAGAMNP
jgi:outer membrane protein